MCSTHAKKVDENALPNHVYFLRLRNLRKRKERKWKKTLFWFWQELGIRLVRHDFLIFLRFFVHIFLVYLCRWSHFLILFEVASFARHNEFR